MTARGPIARARAPCPTALKRKILGARLRRLTRGKDLPAQIRALLTLLRDPEAEIARLARRLQRGMIRRAPLARHADAQKPTLLISADLCPNSS